MSSLSTSQVMSIVDRVLAVREELTSRGVSAGDATVMSGCALGVLLAGDRG
ncbi:MAG: hypothetical protein QG597_3999 [Actinomycetota bacterium]|nr:hypothetical protein [Actinomycetota bacterium]